MAGEKTEKATPKKRRDSKKKGEVVKSTELINCMTFTASILGIKILWESMLSQTRFFVTDILRDGINKYMVFEIDALKILILECIKVIAFVSLPLMVVIMMIGVMANYLQVGFIFSPSSLGLKGNRINPLQGLKRMFSKKTILELFKSNFKMLAIALLAYITIKDEFPKIILLSERSIIESMRIGINIAINISIRISIALTVLSIGDYIFQWFAQEKKLKMSKQEVKDEMKNTDGDPLVKSAIRRIQMAMASRRMMSDVPDADIVITNPTHYAVALKYEPGEKGAPIVIAKGKGLVAQKIKEIANENNVEIVENKEIARTLFNTTKIGEEIPYDLFQAVAEILAYVYTIKKRKKWKE